MRRPPPPASSRRVAGAGSRVASSSWSVRPRASRVSSAGAPDCSAPPRPMSREAPSAGCRSARISASPARPARARASAADASRFAMPTSRATSARMGLDVGPGTGSARPSGSRRFEHRLRLGSPSASLGREPARKSPAFASRPLCSALRTTSGEVGHQRGRAVAPPSKCILEAMGRARRPRRRRRIEGQTLRHSRRAALVLRPRQLRVDDESRRVARAQEGQQHLARSPPAARRGRRPRRSARGRRTPRSSAGQARARQPASTRCGGSRSSGSVTILGRVQRTARCVPPLPSHGLRRL